MKALQTFAAVAISTAALVACQSGSGEKSQYDMVMQQVQAGQPAVTLWIQGMTCPF